MDCSVAADQAFGPVVAPCRRTFDFTLFFEESIFSIVPSSVFIILAIIRLFVLRKELSQVKRGYLYRLKLFASALYASLQLAILVEYCTISHANTRASVPSATLSFVTAIFVCITSLIEHTKSTAPSLLLSVYLLLTSVLDISRTRTLWQIRESIGLSSTFAAGLAAKIAMIVVESWSKRIYLPMENRAVASEELAGFLSKSLFLWLDPLLMKGFRNWLTASDLSPIDSVLSSARLSNKFVGVAYTQLGISPKYALFIGTMRSLRWNVIKPVIPRLLLTAFTFTQPFLVSSILDYLQNSTIRSKNDGYGLIGACFLVYVGIAITGGWYWQQTFRLMTMVRGVLVSSIFEKTLKLGYDEEYESRAMTLMIADVQGIVSSLTHIHEVWASVVETAIATWLLQRQVGLACLSMIGLVIVCTVCTLKVAKMSGPRQQSWFSAMERRLKPTSKMLNSFKAVKMLGADNRIRALIQALRDLEIKAAKPFRTLLVGTVMLSYCTLTLSPVLVFATFIGIPGNISTGLDTSRLFTSLILISLLAGPLIHLFQALPAIGAAVGCFERIQAYLNIDEKFDYRLIEASAKKTPGSPGSSQTELVHPLKSGKQEAQHDDSNVILSISRAAFSWKPNSRIVLKNVNIDVLRGEHVAIIGKVGSGKSLLLKAILGEAEQLEGVTSISTIDLAYCSQTPWLENINGEKTVSRHADDDKAWIKSVIWACALEDVEQLREYTESSIGTGGASLSGGQRQRLALARAVYSRKDILLLDDTFSALDKTTRGLILTRLLGPRGLLRQLGTTVIYTTHDDQFQSSANRVFEVDGEGTPREQIISPQDFKIPETNFHPSLGEKRPAPDIVLDSTKENLVDTAITKKTVLPEKGSGAKLLMQDRTVYKTYFKSVGILDTAIFLAFGVVFSFTLKFPDLWVQWWSVASYGPGSRSLSYWIGIYALLEILPLFALTASVGHLMRRVVPNSARELHSRLLNTAIQAPFPFMSRCDIGGLLNRFNQDLMLIDTKLPIDLFNTAAGFFTSLMQIILITMSVVYVLAILPVLFIIIYFIQNFYLRTSKQLRHLDLESKASLHTKFLETCSGLSTIRAFYWQRQTLEDFIQLLDTSQEPFYLLYSVQRWLQLVLNLVIAGLTIVVLGVAIGIQDKVNPAAIGVAFLNATTLGETLTNFIASWTSLETSLGAVARITSFVRSTPIETEPVAPEEVAIDWPSRGCIEFRNIWATYDSKIVDCVWCLRDISLKIKSGENIAICGRTGSGKSSLILALMAMLTPTSGEIYIDDVDISVLPRSTVRERLNAVPQDVFALANTNREELDGSGQMTDQEIIEILQKCEIWDKVEKSGGLDASTDTATFSSGEAQLFCLARAILKAESSKGGIVVIDEATSSVDESTERKIHRLIVTMLKEKTVFSVLHRLETAVKYDKILVLDEGKVLDYGTPNEVIQRCELFSKFRGRENEEN